MLPVPVPVLRQLVFREVGRDEPLDSRPPPRSPYGFYGKNLHRGQAEPQDGWYGLRRPTVEQRRGQAAHTTTPSAFLRGVAWSYCKQGPCLGTYLIPVQKQPCRSRSDFRRLIPGVAGFEPPYRLPIRARIRAPGPSPT